MSVYTGEAFGCAIRSLFPLPLYVSRERGASHLRNQQRIEICRGDASPGVATRTLGSYTLGTAGLRISATDGLSFLCEPDGRKIHVEAEQSLPDEYVASYLAANAIPAALWMQGKYLLHAGAFCFPGYAKAVLLAGDSGAGKSTLLAELVGAGASMAAEDACAVNVGTAGVRVTGFPAQLLLRQSDSVEGRVPMAVPVAQQLPEADAGTMIVLKTTSGTDQAEPTELHGVAKLQALLRHRYRPIVPCLLGREAADLPLWAECAARLSVYAWNPWQVERADWLSVLSRISLPAEPGGWD